jgi:hypothetical protein
MAETLTFTSLYRYDTRRYGITLTLVGNANELRRPRRPYSSRSFRAEALPGLGPDLDVPFDQRPEKSRSLGAADEATNVVLSWPSGRKELGTLRAGEDVLVKESVGRLR